jgi:hypothetical protein
VGEFMGKLYVELFFVLIVLLYGIFVLIQMVVDDNTLQNYKTIIDVTDITVGSILLFEIVLKIFAFGVDYLKNGWSLFDAIVIVASFLLGILAATENQSQTLLRILRLRVILRILRVLVVFERVKQRSRTMKLVAQRGTIASPVENVLRCLYELRYHPALRTKIRNDIEFAIDVIKNNRLYEINDDLLAGDVDDDTQNWLRGEILKQKDTNISLQVSNEKNKNSNFPTTMTNGSHFPSHSHTQHHLIDTNQNHQNDNLTSIDEYDTPFEQEDDLQQNSGNNSSRTLFKELLPPLEIQAEVEFKMLCQKIHHWNFDIFQIDQITNGNTLIHVGFLLLHELTNTNLFLDEEILINFLTEIQNGYVATNPYHNSIHAADVMQTVNFFINQPEIFPFLRPMDQTLALIAACIHDFKHDGFNNSFHMATSSEIALHYNDHAVLENYHVAQAFVVMKQKKSNLFFKLTIEDFKYARDLIIQMVLATDMAKHFEDVALFKTNLLSNTTNINNNHEDGNGQAHEFTIKSVADKKLLLKMIVHTSDVSNPAKEREIMLKWTDRVVEEFFLQGDEEKKLNLQVSPFMDRETIVLKKMQVGFADFIVSPLFQIWSQILQEVKNHVYQTLVANREFWASQTEEFKPFMIKEVVQEVAQQKKLMIGINLATNNTINKSNSNSNSPISSSRGRRSIVSTLLVEGRK